MQDSILYHQTGVDYYYKTWHTTNENMIIFMHSDGGSIVCSERVYPIKPGVLCFIGSKKYHYTMPDDPDTYERSKAFLSDDALRKMSALFSSETKWSKIFSPDSIVYAEVEGDTALEVERLFAEIDRYKNDDAHFSAILTGCYMRLLVSIEENARGSVSGSQDFISRAIEYINGRITDAITIDEICAAVHTSKYYFCREFKKATGLTVANYILKTRIVMAKGMLLSEAITVGETSEKCGFSSISYFCRVFREETGMSPKSYRKSLGG